MINLSSLVLSIEFEEEPESDLRERWTLHSLVDPESPSIAEGDITTTIEITDTLKLNRRFYFYVD